MSLSARRREPPLRGLSKTISALPTINAGTKRPNDREEDDNDESNHGPGAKMNKQNENIERRRRSFTPGSPPADAFQVAEIEHSGVPTIKVISPTSPSYVEIVFADSSTNSRKYFLDSDTKTGKGRARSLSVSSNEEIESSEESSVERCEPLASNQEPTQRMINGGKREIEKKHILGIKLRKQRAKLWNIVQDCEESIHSEQRFIYMGQGDIDFALGRLDYMRAKRIKCLGRFSDKQRELESCYKAVKEAQDKLLEAEAEMEEL
ncbi:hypothetical protein FSPOR_9118 [Fusarium sporotrichioides]|uniref:Uncharacterized protein n=1 Tax=Fusarium sporotrichioides TaxID=5514 RepID=A0A395RRX9_FUSSP|nr:hypothetical protein FSPOR_9118 [Fusarium sporotrichioides]